MNRLMKQMAKPKHRGDVDHGVLLMMMNQPLRDNLLLLKGKSKAQEI